MSSNLTPQEAEILRLWGVIRKLENRVHMTDKEESLFGEVYQEFKKTPNAAVLDPRWTRQARIEEAARALRGVFELDEKR